MAALPSSRNAAVTLTVLLAVDLNQVPKPANARVPALLYLATSKPSDASTAKNFTVPDPEMLPLKVDEFVASVSVLPDATVTVVPCPPEMLAAAASSSKLTVPAPASVTAPRLNVRASCLQKLSVLPDSTVTVRPAKIPLLSSPGLRLSVVRVTLRLPLNLSDIHALLSVSTELSETTTVSPSNSVVPVVSDASANTVPTFSAPAPVMPAVM